MAMIGELLIMDSNNKSVNSFTKVALAVFVVSIAIAVVVMVVQTLTTGFTVESALVLSVIIGAAAILFVVVVKPNVSNVGSSLMSSKLIGAGILAGFLLITVVIIIAVIFGPQLSYNAPFVEEISMVLAIIIGSAGLVTVLTVVAVIFSALKLQDKNQALGLPEGSVRAIIAISLIILFVMMSIYLFRSIGPTYERIYGPFWNGTDVIPANRTNPVTVIREPSEDQINIADTLVTTVGTLVVALAGFYFGTRAVQVAKGEAPSPTLRIVNPDKTPYPLNPAEGTTLDITVKPIPEDEPLEWEISDGDPKGSLVQIVPKKFRYTRGKDPEDTVTLRFRISRVPDVKAELKVTKATADLSVVDPDKDPHPLDPAKGTTLDITVKPTPKEESVICETPPEGDPKGSLTETVEPTKFKYTRGENPADTVILKFKLKNYPDVKAELKVVKPKPPDGEPETEENGEGNRTGDAEGEPANEGAGKESGKENKERSPKGKKRQKGKKPSKE